MIQNIVVTLRSLNTNCCTISLLDINCIDIFTSSNCTPRVNLSCLKYEQFAKLYRKLKYQNHNCLEKITSNSKPDHLSVERIYNAKYNLCTDDLELLLQKAYQKRFVGI